MSYKVLAQKWRPKRFSEVVGQQHITTTLQNQILNDRIGHAYLFWGPRGTGKTSIARLLAKTINCENIFGGESCNTCRNCKEITQDSSLDVLEIDAASNRGIEPIRDLREEVKLATTMSKYKVYIIDEVHMLTKEAFNALLKTLEEPPRNVIFVLATTEYSKIPKTITSRCQDFEFHYLETDKLIGRLSLIANKEQIKIDKEVFHLLSKQSDGCLRDAQNLLERLISISTSKDKITLEHAQNMLGVSSFTVIKDLANCIVDKDLDQMLMLLDRLCKQGIDLVQCIYELIDHFRKLRLVLKCKELLNIMDVPTSELEILEDQASRISFPIISKIIKILINTNHDVKMYGHAQLHLETALIQMHSITEEKTLDLTAILKKLEHLEHNLEISGLAQPKLVEQSHAPKVTQPQAVEVKATKTKAKAKPKAKPEPKPVVSNVPTKESQFVNKSLKNKQIKEDPMLKNILGMFDATIIAVE